MKKNEEVKFDKRIVHKAIARGNIDPKEYEEFLKSLPDESKNSEVQKVFSEEENTLNFSSVGKS